MVITIIQLIVTHFVGVWIEILNISEAIENLEVTPFVGVWIEIIVTG